MKYPNTRKKKYEGEKKGKDSNRTKNYFKTVHIGNINYSRKNCFQDKFWNIPVKQLISYLSLQNTESKAARQKSFKTKQKEGHFIFTRSSPQFVR